VHAARAPHFVGFNRVQLYDSHFMIHISDRLLLGIVVIADKEKLRKYGDLEQITLRLQALLTTSVQSWLH
jgi:hypothetical protein